MRNAGADDSQVTRSGKIYNVETPTWHGSLVRISLLIVAALGALALTVSALASEPMRRNVDFGSAPLGPRAAFSGIALRSVQVPHAARIVLTAPARRIALIHWNGLRQLLVAPTKGGGFCESLSGAYGGTGCIPGSVRRLSGRLNPGLVGDASGPIAFNGTFFNALGARLEVRYQDGRRNTVPIVWVNGPINAGFFVYKIAANHRQPGHRPVSLSLFSTTGRLLAHQRLSS